MLEVPVATGIFPIKSDMVNIALTVHPATNYSRFSSLIGCCSHFRSHFVVIFKRTFCFDLVLGLWGSVGPPQSPVFGRCRIKHDPRFNSHLSDLVSLLFVLTHPQPLTFDSSRGHIKTRMVAPSAGTDLLLPAN